MKNKEGKLAMSTFSAAGLPTCTSLSSRRDRPQEQVLILNEIQNVLYNSELHILTAEVRLFLT